MDAREIIASHRPTEEPLGRGVEPDIACSCGQRFGWWETWSAHALAALAADGWVVGKFEQVAAISRQGQRVHANCNGGATQAHRDCAPLYRRLDDDERSTDG